MAKIDLLYIPEKDSVKSRVDLALKAIIEVLEYQCNDYQSALAIAVNCLRDIKEIERFHV